jgi:C-1 hydroxylase
MSVEDNKALVRGFIEDLRRGDPASAAAKFDPERYYSHSWGGNLAETWQKMVAARASGTWSDVELETQDLIADGDRVMHRARFTAAHTNTFLGVPATGNRVTFHFIEMWRIENGKIVEHWGGLAEVARLYEQLGATRAPGSL